jgi:hypothetical protein
MSNTEEAAAAVQRALLTCFGPGAAEQIAQAQVRLAWAETVAAEGLEGGSLRSRLVRVRNGRAEVEASEPILAQELGLRAARLVQSVNRRMAGRPGATIVLSGMTVSVGRPGDRRSL